MYMAYDKNGDEVMFNFSIDIKQAIEMGHCFVNKPSKNKKGPVDPPKKEEKPVFVPKAEDKPKRGPKAK